jgi:hypothetical protein
MTSHLLVFAGGSLEALSHRGLLFVPGDSPTMRPSQSDSQSCLRIRSGSGGAFDVQASALTPAGDPMSANGT